MNAAAAVLCDVKADPDFAAQCEMMEAEAKERKGGRPKKGEKPPEQIPEVSKADRETNTILAKSSGTNRKYIEAARKILKEHRELIGPITKPLGGRPVRSHPGHDSPAQAEPTTQRVGQQRMLKGNAARDEVAKDKASSAKGKQGKLVATISQGLRGDPLPSSLSQTPARSRRGGTSYLHSSQSKKSC